MFLTPLATINLHMPAVIEKTGEPMARLPLILILGVGDGGSPAATAAHHLSSVAARSDGQPQESARSGLTPIPHGSQALLSSHLLQKPLILIVNTYPKPGDHIIL